MSIMHFLWNLLFCSNSADDVTFGAGFKFWTRLMQFERSGMSLIKKKDEGPN